jgi:hypothetical protein
MIALLRSIGRVIGSVLNNASFATWAQAALIGIGFYVTLRQIKDADHNNAVNLSAQFATKFVDLDLYKAVGQYRIIQFDAVQTAKKNIPNYEASADPGFEKLFAAARQPIVDAIIDTKKDATDEIVRIEQFFELVSYCLRQGACDSRTISDGMVESMITFYNAVCPYTETLEKNYKRSYFQNTLKYLYFNREIKDPKLYFCREALKVMVDAGAPN